MTTQNSKKQRKPPKGKPFPKGMSGNPGGRPALPPEVRERARAHTVEAVERLAYWMRSEEPQASVRAAESLLNRAWGTPQQSVDVTSEGKGLVVHIHTEGGKSE